MSSDVTPILNTLGHSALQLLAALGLGATLDYGAYLLFPAPSQNLTITRWEEAAVEMLEATAQVMVGGMLLGGVYSYLLSLDSNAADPAVGGVFTSLFFSVGQPALAARLSRVATYVREVVLRPEAEAVSFFSGAFRQNSASVADASYKQRVAVARNTGTAPANMHQVQQPRGKVNANDNSASFIPSIATLRGGAII